MTESRRTIVIGFALLSLTLAGTTTAGTATVDVAVQNDTVAAGDTQRVTVTLPTDENHDVYMVDLRGLPAGSNVTETSDEYVYWKRSETKWLVLSPSDRQVNLTATVQIPRNASGTYTAVARVTDANETRGEAAASFDVTQTSSAVRAIVGQDRRPQISEVQQAIQYWSNGEAVPGTNGARLSISQVQRLIDAWASNRTVA
jgi:hypothetical protein